MLMVVIPASSLKSKLMSLGDGVFDYKSSLFPLFLQA